MKKILILSMFLFPSFVFALTRPQIDSIVLLLRAFGVEETVIQSVSISLEKTLPVTPVYVPQIQGYTYVTPEEQPQKVVIDPVCPSVPTIHVEPDNLKTGRLEGDTAYLTLKENGGLNYFGINFTSDCVSSKVIQYSYYAPSLNDWNYLHDWNREEPMALPVLSTTTPQEVVITAREPNGEYKVRRINVITR